MAASIDEVDGGVGEHLDVDEGRAVARRPVGASAGERDDPGPSLDLDDRGRVAVGQVADVRDVGDDAELVLVAAREDQAAVRRRARRWRPRRPRAARRC